MSTMSHYRPSKRPSVKQVHEWDLLYEDSNCHHWKGEDHNCDVEVFQGYPFPDFYKIVVTPHALDKKRCSKLFYGETAWSDVNRFVYDLGFTRWEGV
jgi:hypothetical protein